MEKNLEQLKKVDEILAAMYVAGDNVIALAKARLLLNEVYTELQNTMQK